MITFKGRIKNIINKPLNMIGIEIARKGSTRTKFNPSCFNRLMHMKGLSFSPKVIFDCGAYVGSWTLKTSKIFPGAQFVLIEPNKNILDKTKANIEGIKPKPLLLEFAVGDEQKLAFLNIWGNEETSLAGSSLLSHVQGEPNTRIETEIYTLDMISKSTGFAPDFIKLDLQGAELPALKGAKSILETAELFVIEFGWLKAYSSRTTPRDLMDIMYDNDYCLYDLVDLTYRPYDGALVAGDFFFIKNDSPLRKYKGYR